MIIPARKEPFLQKTIDSFLEVSELVDVEVIAALDGPTMAEPKGDKRVRSVRLPEPRGMRAAINAGLEAATGDYVMKIDAHCTFGPGFDRIMLENCEEDSLLIPRRYSLDDINWLPMTRKPFRDYHFLHFPVQTRYGYSMAPLDWIGKDGPEIDETMAFQGSCWLANRKFFKSLVGSLDDRVETYGSFAAEQLEIGLKYWLSGRKVLVNKKTWYAHLWKMPRHYQDSRFDPKTHAKFRDNWKWSTRHWFNNEEPNMKYPFFWLIEKFWPVPSWPENRNLWCINNG